MHQYKKYLQQHVIMLPAVKLTKSKAVICSHCSYVNHVDYSFCTNCGYPLQNKLLVENFYKKLSEQNDILFKAKNDVFTARVILYVMASCLMLAMLVLFSNVSIKYLLAIIALMLSGLFFFLAIWSKRNPFPALFTAFIILTTFCAINIFNKLTILLVTVQGITSILLCAALLFIIIKGVQGAYRLTFFKQ